MDMVAMDIDIAHEVAMRLRIERMSLPQPWRTRCEIVAIPITHKIDVDDVVS